MSSGNQLKLKSKKRFGQSQKKHMKTHVFGVKYKIAQFSLKTRKEEQKQSGPGGV